VAREAGRLGQVAGYTVSSVFQVGRWLISSGLYRRFIPLLSVVGSEGRSLAGARLTSLCRVATTAGSSDRSPAIRPSKRFTVAQAFVRESAHKSNCDKHLASLACTLLHSLQDGTGFIAGRAIFLRPGIEGQEQVCLVDSRFQGWLDPSCGSR
jgi:hypothetical protein